MIEQETIYQWMNNGNYEEAIKALFNNIEENPNIIENYINAGIVLAENGAVYYNLANLYYEQSRFQEAIKLYQRALKYNMNPIDTNYMIGMSFSQLDAQREALPFFMTAAELDQTLDTEVQFQYGLTLCHLEMFQEAIKQLNYVLSINPNHVDALYNLGLATYMETEDADEAIQYFDKAIQIDPKHLLSQHAKQTFKSLKNEEE